MGVASAFGHIGGLSPRIIIGLTIDRIGFASVFAITTIVLVMGTVAVAVLGILTAGKSLEPIMVEELGKAPDGLAPARTYRSKD